MRRWIISDTHFGHTKLCTEGIGHTRRPADVDQRIIRNWKQLVAPEDLVIHLGDIAFTFMDTKAVFDDLPGRKVLLIGNHDAHTVSWYMANGFAFAADGLLLGGVWYTHKPARKLPYGARINVHGHLHNRWSRGQRVFPHCRCFALEYEDYAPRKLDSFLRSIEREKPEMIDYKAYDRAFTTKSNVEGLRTGELPQR